jgi:phosphatidylglycerophosphatase GEP4
MLPHADVPDVRWIDWQHLANLGFKGCVFDKDNTLTTPYALQVQPDVAAALKECQEVFKGNVVLFSNSAGKVCYHVQCGACCL